MEKKDVHEKENNEESTQHITILAYGSLIWDPGNEIKQHTIAVIDCFTPFNIEYAQISGTRGSAPTLTKVEGFGGKTRAKLFVLDYHNNPKEKKRVYSLVCKREGIENEKPWDGYGDPPAPIFREDILEYSTVFYCAFKIKKDIESIVKKGLLVKKLVEWAKKSVKECAKSGKIEKNGVRYLINCYKAGIITPLTEAYIQELGGMDIEEIERKILNEKKSH